MKSDKEINEYLKLAYSLDKNCPKLPMYNLKQSGNLIKDFAIFTDMQSGGRSCDPKDTAAKYLPPQPHIDGRYYHTVRDITWQSFHALIPAGTPELFYSMPYETRQIFINHFINGNRVTESESVNFLLSYFAWGSGSSNPERTYYKIWFNSTIQKDIKEIGEFIVFNRLTDIRLWRYSLMRTYAVHGAGWRAGTLIFWNLFKPKK